MNKPILTVVVTAHDEGLIAHKTMRSVFEALNEVKEAGYTYEVLVHIDNGDEATEKYFERYENNKNVRVFKNRFGDLGLSRNFATSEAKGKYVAFLDGDDLISSNWYINAIKTLEKSESEIVVHPEAILTFGVEQPNVLTLQSDSCGIEKDTLILLGENRWCSVAMAARDTFIKHPYKKMGNGYSFEDYAFNAETIADGIRHRIAEKTVLFYRKSGRSMLDKANGDNAVLPYNKLFDYEVVKKYDGSLRVENSWVSLKNRGYKIYKKIRNNNVLNYFIMLVAKMALKVIDRVNKKAVVPKWVVDEWTNINHIDTQLYPFKNVINNVKRYSADEHIEVGKTYIKIANRVDRRPDYIFIVPWLVRGGAERALLNYIGALKKIYPDWYLVVIATLPANNTWVSKLPDGVGFIDFGNMAFGLNPDMQDKLMSRIIVQLKCKNLHIINSEYGYDWVRRHLRLVKYNYNLNVSLFAWEYIADSKMKAVYSYDNPCLFEIFSAVKNVFTDNEAMVKYTLDNNGFDGEKFKVHYQPIENQVVVEPKRDLVEQKKLHVLWASRIVPLKLPDLVAEIGKHLGRGVEIDVYGEIGGGVSKKIFSDVAAISYKGAYDGFSSLPVDKYDLLLYTSLTDGMPNVILEATMMGLPIIASNDGGVGEFIKNKKTGLLIEDYLNYKPYVEAIEWAAKNMDEMNEYARNAQKLLNDRHSFKKFVSVVKRDIG